MPNELGIYDMSGNVMEWCEDTYQPYPNCSSVSGTGRVIRGGGWGTTSQYCRVACRFSREPDGRRSYIGFRLALSH